MLQQDRSDSFASERVDGKLILSEAVKTLDIKAAGK